MKIIEFSGMPRCGKTTILDLLMHHSDGFIFYGEEFNLVPFDDESSYKYNLWYANYCVDRLKKFKNENIIYLLDRSILDRIAFGWAMVSFGKFTVEQNEKYQAILEPYVGKQDLTFVKNISPEQSLKNAVGYKKMITRDLEFLKHLNKAYGDLGKKYKNVYYIPEKLNIEGCLNYVIKILKEKKLF
jgi:hypothetical protein